MIEIISSIIKLVIEKSLISVQFATPLCVVKLHLFFMFGSSAHL